MKPDKHFLAATCTVMAAACLIAVTWAGTFRATQVQRAEATARITATLTSQAVTLTEQINRQILALDQTLRLLVHAWQADPNHFNLEAAQSNAVVLNGLSQDMVLTDENGIIRQSSVNEAINQNASGLDYFRVLADPSDTGDHLYVGPAAIDGIMRQWHMNAARALHYPDGSFAGVIDVDYRIAAITDVFSQVDLGAGGFLALAGLDDGKLRDAVGPTAIDPGVSVAGTPMFTAIRGADSGVWTGPSAGDAVQRIHAFRHLPGHNLVVVVAMSEDEALRPARDWRHQADLFAGCITALLSVLALALIQGIRMARRSSALIAEDRARLAASDAQLEVAKAVSATKAEQLEATLASMSDGVSIFDARLCLVEWNTRFPEIAAVPAEILRIGLPMEEILRAQIRTGQFGTITDPESEVTRRIAHLHVARSGMVQRQRPDGHTVELRRNRLPDGGFIALYTDTTKQTLAEQALRNAREAGAAASREKSRFVAIISHEIRTPLNAMLNTIRLLRDSTLTPAQRSLLATAHQSGEMLSALINDILDMSQMEAGKLAIRPSLFELRQLLESTAEMFAAPAAERGITIDVSIQHDTPQTLLTDPARLRQVLLNLLSNAVKYAPSGTVRLIAEARSEVQEAIRITVADDGPVIGPDARERLFHPFSRLDRPMGEGPLGNGLGLSICHQLVTLMGGNIGHEPWRPKDRPPADAQPRDNRPQAGREGNAFWISFPDTVVPRNSVGTGAGRSPSRAVGTDGVPHRLPPATRILVTEDIVANQLVTAALLRRDGHHVDIAGDGPAAIQAIQSMPYDIVFMDIFMPGMSGQEATRIIRTLPEPARSTPIVALTANVGPEDEASFKAAGMDGVLRKPVSAVELLASLERHVWFHHRSTVMKLVEPSLPNASTPSGRIPVLAAARIDELRANLSPETFGTLIDECLVDMDHRLPALRRAIIAGAPGAVAAHAHALVGMAAGYGMAALEARLRTLMAAAREADMTSLEPTIITDLEADFAEAERALRDILRREVV